MLQLSSVLLLPFVCCVNVFFKIIDLGWWIQMLLAKRINNCIKNKKRLTYDPASGDLTKVGIVPSNEAIALERPGHEKDEEIKIIGFNSRCQALIIDFKWQPKLDGTAVSAYNLVYEDGDKNKFTSSGVDLIQNVDDNCEYKAKGLCLEVLHPFKRLRVRFRGFLRKNDTEELIFVNLKLLWLNNSNVFNYQSDHNPKFIAKEVVRSSKSAGLFGEIPNFENRIEQFGQMKGTIQLGNENESELYLWGSRSKRFDDKIELRVRRLFGYTHKGLAFHVGIVYDWMNCYKYRYGIVYNGKFKATAIKSASGDWPLNQESQEHMCFKLETIKKFEIKVKCSNDLLQEVTVNGIDGKAMQWLDEGFPKLKPSSSKHWACQQMSNKLVVAIDNEEAENQMTSGGKGASLGLLTALRKKLSQREEQFIVPKGIVVTTNAYNSMLKQNPAIRAAIEEVEKSISDSTKLKEKCSDATQTISSTQLPIDIRSDIENMLNEVYQFKNNFKFQFAVRSSAVGEDSEVMSTAGQLTTFLGVKSLDELCSSVMKCWASQFDFVAVEYKRGYGQAVNQPMAVVIQPMVDCEAAGVMFTCDPISGDQRRVLITANHGLGESVVAAIAEPDTVELNVSVKRSEVGEYSTDKLTIAGIKSIQIGTKNKMVNLNGIVDVDENQSKKCSISEENATRLGKVALIIKDFFCDDRDIEWGIKDGQVYIFQSRPVTNLNTISDFELIHEMDTGLPSEFEVLTRANIGDGLPKTMSVMGMEFFNLWISRYYALNNQLEGKPAAQDFYAGLLLDICWNSYYCFFNLKNSAMMKITGSEQSAVTKGIILALFGHPVDDPELNLACSQIAEPEPVFQPIRKLIMVFFNYLRADYFKEFDEVKQKHKVFIYDKTTSREYYSMLDEFCTNYVNENISHLDSLTVNSLLNLILISFLRTNEENPHLYSDFTILVSQCKNLISADLANQMEEVAKSIDEEGNKELFLKLSNEEAKQFLTNSQTEASKKFAHFLDRHGHRAYCEFDVFVKSLEMDSTLIIDGIRNRLSTETQKSLKSKKEEKSVDELVESLKTPLSRVKKMLMKKIVPLAWASTRRREMTKSNIILLCNTARKICWSLAECMYREGLLPEKELLFYLNFDELQQFTTTRNPLLVAKAKRRFKLQQQLNTWKFDEICKGYEFKPKQATTQFTLSSDEALKGTPVSHGQVTARVCVAKTIEEAKLIQPGDILVTYSTDIGWSPFFPIISGIITEIGGLVSHGAVIAREFGIPCLVGVEDACLHLATGQLVTLDTRQGTVSRVIQNNELNLKSTKENNKQPQF